jgi:hypothetical protein
MIARAARMPGNDPHLSREGCRGWRQTDVDLFMC